MYLAHVRSFKAELMLFVPFLLILARLLAEASGVNAELKMQENAG